MTTTGLQFSHIQGAYERLTAFMSDCKDAGVPRKRALIIAALSWPETQAAFFLPMSGVYADATCYPVRQILALERGNPRLNNDLPDGARADAALMQFLNASGFLNTNGKRVTDAVGRTDNAVTPNDQLSTIFEWCIDNRNGSGIGLFSIGPTQMYLAYSPLSTIGPANKMTGRFSQWDDLWYFYTAPDVATLTSRTPSGDDPLAYLPTNVSSFPTPGVTALCGSAGDADCIETYLANYQRGSSIDWNTKSNADYANMVIATFNAMSQYADSINYR